MDVFQSLDREENAVRQKRNHHQQIYLIVLKEQPHHRRPPNPTISCRCDELPLAPKIRLLSMGDRGIHRLSGNFFSSKFQIQAQCRRFSIRPRPLSTSRISSSCWRVGQCNRRRKQERPTGIGLGVKLEATSFAKYTNDPSGVSIFVAFVPRFRYGDVMDCVSGLSIFDNADLLASFDFLSRV